jgi:hypothetical protein
MNSECRWFGLLALLFPAGISIPQEMSRDSLRLGMSGSATTFSEKAGVLAR